MFSVSFLPGEYFWGGAVAWGEEMPLYAGKTYERDFRIDPRNQMMPMFLSSKGRYIWSEHMFKVWVDGNRLCFEGDEFELVEAGSCLRDAYRAAMKAHFPFDGKPVMSDFFRTAQYNTWMECTYHPTQEKVLKYAHDILKNGFEPGILIIDEGWASFYGNWTFDPATFPDPKAMIDELHELSFKVMLWVVPLVRADGELFVKQIRPEFNPDSYDEIFLRNNEGDVALVSWWNGYSALLDFRKPCDTAFLKRQLDALISDYGVDGFKFDGGSYDMYHPSSMMNGTPRIDHDPAALNAAWNEFGTHYSFHEYKDTFKGGGKSSIQRLCDRRHSWEGNGIDTLLPSAILAGLFGHPYICPDMIGGGEWTCVEGPNAHVDEELFIRMAQASALMPMMQFSWAPWRVLSEAGMQCMLDAARLHKQKSEYLLAQVENARKTGEPIVRCMDYQYPGQGYEAIANQFIVGNDILVCPVITQGTTERNVALPAGNWRDDEGNTYEGGKTITVTAPVNKLIWFEKAD